MPGQGMRVSACCTVAFHAAHGERLCEGEGFHGQVVSRSGQCRECVRARAGRISESDGSRPGSYESSDGQQQQN
eukprot:2119190-Pleurochrysis_carterae.AAC.1